METTLDMPVIEDQRAFNLRRWNEVCADPSLIAIEGRVETDRFGYIIMTPPPGLPHSGFQFEIGFQLRTLLANGKVFTECPISTSEGVRAADVAWISKSRAKTAQEGSIFVDAPEICVEVLSPGNTQQEIAGKKRLYFEGGGEEVWICDLKGGLHFFARDAPEEERSASAICPEFPRILDS